ncbi:hypothetical protein [Streptomyces rhizosphaerihabitans]|uniref:hypothetical protein n=1 Tax=Streptomyces rhizosphaerihabitans TaxID=1266770 RepID=UPI0021BE319E|nr:hypothetical protein [Streptomyces rhizosphaerihabitans]MCT9007335.1 hypothetical protein [Streptomyces rhizosphaerihabitans]
MSVFSRAAVSTGAPLAILSVRHDWHGVALAALVTIVAVLGGEVVGAVSRWALAPAQRQQRWLLKHGHVTGQLTARQLVELTRATHAAELSARPETTPPPAPRTDTTGL